MTKSVGMHEAKTQLSRLVRLVATGEEVVITSRGEPVARLVAPVRTTRELGFHAGRYTVPDDFDAPLPDDVLDAFDGHGA